MPIDPPTEREIETIAEELGLHLSSKDVLSFRALTAPFVVGLEALEAAEDLLPRNNYPRTRGEFPTEEENPLGAWYLKSRIEGSGSGKLAGREVVLKDNIMVADLPMMNGTKLLEGYVAPTDATVVTRILDAGGVIVGKAVCEAFCLSGGSHTSESGPVRNPHDPRRHAGGSSSGSAALVAAGEVDLAIGGDQGGSIRMPSSFCGTVGMKPTHGLVPYTGILALEPTIDHAGPITATVADNALLLEVIAGDDGLDSRQVGLQLDDYTHALDQGVDGLRIAVLQEGFGNPGGNPGVDEKVRAAADCFAALGAKISRTSIPVHRQAGALLAPVFQSAFVHVLETDGMGLGRENLYVASLAERMSGWRARADELPETVKTILIAMQVMRKRYGWRYYAKAMNQVRRVRAAYDAALRDADVLLLPTTPMTAPLLPEPGAPREEILAAAFAPVANTLPFDHSHHPALSLPCGTSDGLPVGLMLVGRAWEESTLYRAASAFEQSGDWRER